MIQNVNSALDLYRRAQPYLKVARGIYGAYKRGRGGSARPGKKYKYRSGSGVTAQHDKTVIYRRKKMPYRKKKKWVSFKRKVNYIINKSVGTNTIVRNSSFTIGSDDSNQSYLAVHLYGMTAQEEDGGEVPLVHTQRHADLGRKDILDIFTTEGDGESSKIRFSSGVLDLTYMNKTTTTPIEVDIYDIVYTKKVDYYSFTSMVLNAQNLTSTIGTSTALTMNQRGVTPFDLPMLSSMGIKILRKMKYLLGTHQAATYQVRNPKERTIIGESTGDEYVLPGFTRTCLIIAKPVDTSVTSWSMSVGATRKYSYHRIAMNVTKDGYMTNP